MIDPDANVARACGALLRERHILMVHHREPGDVYWTLPGGHVERGETPEEAVVREMFEETGIRVSVGRPLWDEPLPDTYMGTAGAVGRCFIVEAEAGQEPILGLNPEEANLPPEERILQAVAWQVLDEMHDDPQVSRVIAALESS